MLSVDSHHNIKTIVRIIKSFFFNLCSYNSYNKEIIRKKQENDSKNYNENLFEVENMHWNEKKSKLKIRIETFIKRKKNQSTTKVEHNWTIGVRGEASSYLESKTK